MKISLGYALAAMLVASLGAAFGLFFAIEMWGYVPTLDGKLEWGMFIILYTSLSLGIPAMAVGEALETIQDGLDDARKKRQQARHSWAVQASECVSCRSRTWGFCHDHEPADWL